MRVQSRRGVLIAAVVLLALSASGGIDGYTVSCPSAELLEQARRAFDADEGGKRDWIATVLDLGCVIARKANWR